MWGGVRELERELVQRRRWLGPEELRLRLVLSTLMPAPRFIGLAGLVGFQLRGWWGSLVAVLSLLLPSSLMVLGVVMLASGRPLPPVWEALQRSVSLAVVGVLLGNAWRQASGPSLRFRTRLLGVLLSASVAVAVHRGVPLGAVALGGLVVGWWLLREESP
jgi:chromate transporter